MSDWWYRTKGRLLCYIGHHDWSCRMSWQCRGLGDHYCRRCLYGLPEWMESEERRAVEGDK